MTALDLLRPHTTHNAQERGWDYVELVDIVQGSADTVRAKVHGTGIYEVRLRVDGNRLRVWCTCPYFSDRGTSCKHLWATAARAEESGWLRQLPAGTRVLMDFKDLEDHELLIPTPESYRSSGSVPRVARPAAAKPPEWELALDGVKRKPREGLPAASADSQLLYVLTVPPHATVTEIPLVVERRERKRDGSWGKPQPSRLTLGGIAYLPENDDRWALALIHATSAIPREGGTYGYGFTSQPLPVEYVKAPMLDMLLHRLCNTGRVRLRTGHPDDPQRAAKSDNDVTLAWEPGEPWRLRLVVTREEDTTADGGLGEGGLASPKLAADRKVSEGGRSLAGTPASAAEGRFGEASPKLASDRGAREGGKVASGYRVDAFISRGERRVSAHDFALLTDSIAVLGNVAAPFDPAGGFAWARQLRSRRVIHIPLDSRRELVDSIAASGVEEITLPEDLQWEERTVAPRFRATIGAPTPWGTCAVDVVAEYETTRAPIDGSVRIVSGDGRVVYRRDLRVEQEALFTLKRHGVSFDGAGDRYYNPHHGEHEVFINARKLSAFVHSLVAHGWLVEAEGLRYRSMNAPSLHIKSNIDWFELDAYDDSGAAIGLPELLKAIKSGNRLITLDDGTIGMLPEEWLARVAPLVALGDTSETTVRFKPSQVALLDALLAAQPAVDWDEGFARAREQLRRFEGVRAEDAPPTFRGTLRGYQREALGWMRFLRDFGFGGCLADDMGLGKTVMVLAMLEQRRLDSARAHKPSLVVLPRSLLFNWMSEASRFAPELRILDFAHAERHEAIDAIPDADLVLTTYGTLRRDVPALQNHHFDYVILDEAQAIKNAGTATAKAVRLLRADHRLALTGTPVENHLGELQSLFDFLNPGLLGRGDVFELRGITTIAESREHIARLAKGLRPFFLRRTKEQVAPELPSRTEETLYCELEADQRRLYNELRDHYRRVLLKKVERDGLAKSKLQIFEALLRLRQAACHTGLLDRGPEGPRYTFDSKSNSAKFDLLLPRLKEVVEEGSKALVFSQFTTLLALLRDRLAEHGIVYEYLDGQTRDRAERVARFQDDENCALFLISLKAGGVGLNLTAAEYVFLLDPWWNPAVEAQAIDRTHRIGQSKPVFAYRLVAQNTVEERILELQSRKRALADAILEAGTGGLRGLQREDLELLLA
jgi:superfamily II DNA or RNA helicase